jgi:hypothetical protein
MNSVQGGVGPLVSNLRDIDFIRNVLVNIQALGGIDVPGVRWRNNTMFRAPWQTPGYGYGGSLSRGDPTGGAVVNNMMVQIGEALTPSQRLQYGFSSVGCVGGCVTPYFQLTAEAICFNLVDPSGPPANQPPLGTVGLINNGQGGANCWRSNVSNQAVVPAVITAIFNQLASSAPGWGYLNANGTMLPPAINMHLAILAGTASCPTAMTQLPAPYTAYTPEICRLLDLTAAKNLTIQETFDADSNLIYPAATQTTCLYDGATPPAPVLPYPSANYTPGQICERNGLNPAAPIFQNTLNPLGPDGVPFTTDDGLIPLPGSPGCNAGRGGVDIGAYSCTQPAPPTQTPPLPINFASDPPPATGTTRYVSPNLSNTATGIPNCTTITQCITQSADGDNIVVYPGDYSDTDGTLQANGTRDGYAVINKQLNITAFYPANMPHTTPALRSTLRGFRVQKPNTTLNGFDLSRYNVGIGTGHINIDQTVTNFRIVNNVIRNSSYFYANDYVITVTGTAPGGDAVNGPFIGTLVSPSAHFITQSGFKAGQSIYLGTDINRIFDFNQAAACGAIPICGPTGYLNHDTLKSVISVDSETQMTIQDQAGCRVDYTTSPYNLCMFTTGSRLPGLPPNVPIVEEHMVYTSHSGQSGVNGINLTQTSTAQPSNGLIQNNHITDIGGMANIAVYGNNIQVQNNTLDHTAGFRVLGLNGNNNIFRYNVIMQSPRWPPFVPPLPCPPVCHSAGTGTFDLFATFFYSSSSTLQQTLNNEVSHNMILNIANSQAQIEFASMSLNCPAGNCGNGLLWANNVSIGLENNAAFHYLNISILNNTFFNTAKAPFANPNSSVSVPATFTGDMTDVTHGAPVGMLVRSNAFIASGCPLPNPPTTTGWSSVTQTCSGAPPGSWGWYSFTPPTPIGTTVVPDYDMVAQTPPAYAPVTASLWQLPNGTEAHGINGGNPLFNCATFAGGCLPGTATATSSPATIASIFGPDGIPFTMDDGLIPQTGSPLCGAGLGGVDIGAYSCLHQLVGGHPIPFGSVFSGNVATLPPPIGTPPTITSVVCPQGIAGQFFTCTFASSGDQPQNWSTTDSLPPGLTLSAAGVLSGVPTTAASTTFAVTATNVTGSNTASCTVVIVPGGVTPAPVGGSTITGAQVTGAVKK